MRNIIFNIGKFVSKLLSKIIKTNKNSITVIFEGYSGSNLSPIIDEFKDNKYGEYDFNIIDDKKTNLDYETGVINRFTFYKRKIEKYKILFRSNVVLMTHGFSRLRYDNTVINLWHGIPIKSMYLMHKSYDDKSSNTNLTKDDYFISTSNFFTTIMNSCLGITNEQYIITGYPRNDYLLKENGFKNLKDLLNVEIKGKIVLFMPTYRKDRSEEDISNIFNFADFDIEGFNVFLEENNITLLLKLHPTEENLVLSKYNSFLKDRIRIISGKDLEEKEMDLYKIINSIDLLITDYSSIYFDFLLLDRPIIFTPVDLDKYRNERGLLLEPYEFWTPGYKCLNQKDLQDKIISELENPEYFMKEREIIKSMFHEHHDGQSTDRVVKLIKEIIDGGN